MNKKGSISKKRRYSKSRDESPWNIVDRTNDITAEKKLELEPDKAIKEAYYKVQKAGTHTSVASPTTMNRRNAFKEVKKQITETFNTRPQVEKETRNQNLKQ